ncbi:MAG: radical SAM protein [Candidatus Liptonbacteria bacterium]
MSSGASNGNNDFVSKLRQPSLLPRVMDYVRWQQTLRKAVRDGRPLPDMATQGPVSINLDLTTSCNFRCPHCIDIDVLNGPTRHNADELASSIKNLAARGLKSAILIGGGEPTLYPKFGEVVSLLKSLGLQVAVVSNGSRLEVVYNSFDQFAAHDWVRFSLDAATNGTFLEMHLPRKPITLDQICGWVPKLRAKNPLPLIGFSFVIAWQGAHQHNANITENIHEIIGATKRARDFGFSYISLKPFLVRQPNGAEVMDPKAMDRFQATMKRIDDAIEEAKSYETDCFKVAVSVNLAALESGAWRNYTRQPRTCHKQAFQQVLSPLGLFNCPAHRGVAKARIADKDAYATNEACAQTQALTTEILNRFDASKECAEVTCFYNKMNWWIENTIEGRLDPETQELLSEQHNYYF